MKAVAAEATSRRAGPALFERHTVAELMRQSDYALEQHGRLTDPMAYDSATAPETNPLVPLDSVAQGAGTPTSKSIPVLLSASRAS